MEQRKKSAALAMGAMAAIASALWLVLGDAKPQEDEPESAGASPPPGPLRVDTKAPAGGATSSSFSSETVDVPETPRGTTPRTPSAMRVSRLFVYPVKSMRGVEVSRAHVEERGFRHDRRWMVIDQSGSFLSQRRNARMALVTVRVHEPAPPSPSASSSASASAASALGSPFARPTRGSSQTQTGADACGPVVLELACPDMAHSLRVPVRQAVADVRAETVRVWDDHVSGAFDQGQNAARWLSQALKMDGLRLVYMGASCRRAVDPEFRKTVADETSFADGFPFLAIGQASLDDLNRRILRSGAVGAEAGPGQEPGHEAGLGPSLGLGAGKRALPVSRFRPNIVLAGLAPYEEDGLESITVVGAGAASRSASQRRSGRGRSSSSASALLGGGVRFHVVKACSRCKITTIDQDTGHDPHSLKAEPLATLATYRAKGDDVFLGQNLLLDMSVPLPAVIDIHMRFHVQHK